MSVATASPKPPVRSQSGQRAKLIIAAALFIAAAGVMVGAFYHSAPPVATDLHRMIGSVMAEETAKLAGPGTAITLIAADTKVVKNPAADAQLESFHKALRKAGLAVAGTHLFRLDPLRQVRVPPGDYFEVLRTRKANDVIVSFLGPPLLSPEQRGRLSTGQVRVIAVCPPDLLRQTSLKDLFAEGALTTGLVNRDTPEAFRPGTDDRTRFNQLYSVVTAANPGQNEGGTQ